MANPKSKLEAVNTARRVEPEHVIAASHVMKDWTRIAWKRDLGAYENIPAEGYYPDPVWPGLPFQELLRIAFRDRIITTAKHPVIDTLRGL